MSLTIVGLGPGPVELVAPGARAALQDLSSRIFVRTALHPAVPALLGARAFEALDALYDSAPSMSETLDGVTSTIASAAARGQVVLALPGDGVLGEDVLDRFRQAGLAFTLMPGVSVAPLVLVAAGMCPSAGVQAVDALALGGSGVDLRIELNPRWHAVVVGLYSQAVAGDVKLALQRVYPPDHPVVLVAHPGLHDQRVTSLALADVDRGRVELDHLTHLVLAPTDVAIPTGSVHGLRAVVSRLRQPEVGCPWDLEQTHRSLEPYMIEEAYEAVEAIEEGSPAELAEELGDVLLQVALHAEVADQEGAFELNDVVREISTKLIHRHPHVFGEVQVAGSSDVVRNWDAIKAAEHPGEPRVASALDGVARSLPALKQAALLAKRASKAGFDWPSREGALAKVREEIAELADAASREDRTEEIGDLLWIIAKVARDDKIDPEAALRAASRKFVLRFHEVESIARERGWESLGSRPIDDLLGAWSLAKTRVSSSRRGDH